MLPASKQRVVNKHVLYTVADVRQEVANHVWRRRRTRGIAPAAAVTAAFRLSCMVSY
jgi:hypothetical protein